MPCWGMPDVRTTGEGNVVGNGTYRTGSGLVRKFLCRACGRTFSERSNTAFFDLRSEDRGICSRSRWS